MLLSLVAVILPVGTGCSRNVFSPSGIPPAERAKAAQQQAHKAMQAKEEEARQQLEQILPPSKNLYLHTRSQDAYGNPFLLVNPKTLTLTVIYPDHNPHGFGTGGMLRPASARRQRLEIRLSDLPEALASLPPDVWPYGRVVGVEEAPSAPGSERIAIRRNVEATIQVLNDLGVIVDEWTGSNGSLLR